MIDLLYGGASDVGLVRSINEDAWLAAPPIFVVADGMGGHHGGDVASGIVTEEFAALSDRGYEPRDGARVISETLAAAQQRIREYSRSQGSTDAWYAGTTAVVAMLVEDDEGDKWLLANLGDSRVYKLNDDVLEQVSVDHSLVQELVDAGALDSEQAAHHPDRHVITRALGGPSEVEAEFFLLPLASAHRLVLCSDGVSGMVGDDVIAEILRTHPDPRDAADRLVEAAVQAGGKDNATALVVDVVGLSETPVDDADTRQLSLREKLGALP